MWWVVGGWVVVCKPILVFSLSLGQAEQLCEFWCEIMCKQAGAELGKARLKHGLDFTLIVCRFGLIVLVGLI